MSLYKNIRILKPSEIVGQLIRKTVWNITPHKSFITGLWLRDFLNTKDFENCFTRVLDQKKYYHFKNYLRNIVLLTPLEHSLWTLADEEDQILYSQKVEKQFEGKISADWQKMKDLAELLKQEYEASFPYTHKGIVGYQYNLDEQLTIISALNKKYLVERRN